MKINNNSVSITNNNYIENNKKQNENFGNEGYKELINYI